MMPSNADDQANSNMQTTPEEASKAMAVAAQWSRPWTNAQLACDFHEEWMDLSEGDENRVIYEKLRNQVLLELAAQDRDALAEFLIQHSVGKAIALGVLREFKLVCQDLDTSKLHS
jgi:hypothetical protein